MDTNQIYTIAQSLLSDDMLQLLQAQIHILDQYDAHGCDTGHFSEKMAIMRQQIELQKQLIALDDKYQMTDLGIEF